MHGLRYHLATLPALILIVTFSAHIFTNAIQKRKKMKKKFGDMNELITESVIENVTDLAEVMVEVRKMRKVRERIETWKKRRNEYQNEYNRKVREKEKSHIPPPRGKQFWIKSLGAASRMWQTRSESL